MQRMVKIVKNKNCKIELPRDIGFRYNEKKEGTNMKTFEYVITDEVGLHARPAGLFVKEASKYTAAVTVSCHGKEADAKRILAVMGLGVKKGDTITLHIEGVDEAKAAEVLERFCKENL